MIPIFQGLFSDASSVFGAVKTAWNHDAPSLAVSVAHVGVTALGGVAYMAAATTGRVLAGTAQVVHASIPAMQRVPLLTERERGAPEETPHAATPHAATPHAATPHAATPRPETPRPETPHPATPHPATPRPATPRPVIDVDVDEDGIAEDAPGLRERLMVAAAFAGASLASSSAAIHLSKKDVVKFVAKTVAVLALTIIFAVLATHHIAHADGIPEIAVGTASGLGTLAGLFWIGKKIRHMMHNNLLADFV